MKPMLIPFTFFGIITCLFSQKTWHVDSATSSVNPDGLSWASAFANLHTALNVAQSGDEIWVAKGTYKPTSGNDRNARFVLTSGVKILGGFSGTENTVDQRNIALNQSVLSGDIGVQGDSTDNSYNIIYGLNTDLQTTLDGLTVEYGNANNIADPNLQSNFRSGAAIYLETANFEDHAFLNLKNCLFQQNRGVSFGSVYANGNLGQAGLYIESCEFKYNYAGYAGGGVALENYNQQDNPLILDHCNFEGNISNINGGAVWGKFNAPVLVRNCNFKRNTAYLLGAGIYLDTYNSTQSYLFEHCDFEENESTSYNGEGSCITIIAQTIFPTTGEVHHIYVNHCRFVKNKQTALYSFGKQLKFNANNCIFSFNEVIRYPGILNNLPSVSSINLSGQNTAEVYINCLFYKNKYEEFIQSTDTTVLNNCIFVDDGKETQITRNINARYKIFNCIFSQNSCAELGDEVVPGYFLCQNNQFATDPLFIAPDSSLNADFRLQLCSSAINAGKNDVVDLSGAASDLAGMPRIQNGIVDIGPYETEVTIQPEVQASPSCAGAQNASVQFSGNICLPITFQWDNGQSTGNTLDSLEAGLYEFTVTDSRGLEFYDSILIPEPPLLTMTALVQNIQCPGGNDGAVTLQPTGGTPPYAFDLQNPPLAPLSTGVYVYSIADAHGCTTATSAVISEPPPFQFYYTVQNATGPQQADGAIHFDSITGGWHGLTVLPVDSVHLLPGNYQYTVTDAEGCTATVEIQVGYTTGTGEIESLPVYKIYPNPMISGGVLTVVNSESNGFEGTISDWSGKILQQFHSATSSISVPVIRIPAGCYQMQIRGSFGRTTQYKLFIAN